MIRGEDAKASSPFLILFSQVENIVLLTLFKLLKIPLQRGTRIPPFEATEGSTRQGRGPGGMFLLPLPGR